MPISGLRRGKTKGSINHCKRWQSESRSDEQRKSFLVLQSENSSDGLLLQKIQGTVVKLAERGRLQRPRESGAQPGWVAGLS